MCDTCVVSVHLSFCASFSVDLMSFNTKRTGLSVSFSVMTVFLGGYQC